MSASQGDKPQSSQLPEALIRGLASKNSARGQATCICTVDNDDFPRLSLISSAEVSLVSQDRLVLALWANSRTVSNIRRHPQATLFRIDEQIARTVRLSCAAPIPFTLSNGQELVAITANVIDVMEDSVTYASLVGTIEFELHAADEVLPRWQEVQDRLKAFR